MCSVCIRPRFDGAQASPAAHRPPRSHHKPAVRDIYGHGLCLECNTVWRFNRDNSVEIITD